MLKLLKAGWIVFQLENKIVLKVIPTILFLCVIITVIFVVWTLCFTFRTIKKNTFIIIAIAIVIGVDRPLVCVCVVHTAVQNLGSVIFCF